MRQEGTGDATRHGSKIRHVRARQRVERMRSSASRLPAFEPRHLKLSAFPAHKSLVAFEKHPRTSCQNLGLVGQQSRHGKNPPAPFATLIVEPLTIAYKRHGSDVHFDESSSVMSVSIESEISMRRALPNIKPGERRVRRN